MPDTAQGRASCSQVCAVTRIYRSPPVWDGLALLGEAFIPHYRSPERPETTAIDQVVARYQADGVPYRTLHDGKS
jgi:hypothetical protein